MPLALAVTEMAGESFAGITVLHILCIELFCSLGREGKADDLLTRVTTIIDAVDFNRGVHIIWINRTQEGLRIVVLKVLFERMCVYGN